MLIHVTSGGWGLHPTQKTRPSVAPQLYIYLQLAESCRPVSGAWV